MIRPTAAMSHCTKSPGRDHSVAGGRDHLGIGGLHHSVTGGCLHLVLGGAIKRNQQKEDQRPLRWPASSRNGGRLQIGTVAGMKSESPAGLRRNSHCSCLAPDDAAPASRLMALMVGRTTPELERVQAEVGARLSFREASRAGDDSRTTSLQARCCRCFGSSAKRAEGDVINDRRHSDRGGALPCGPLRRGRRRPWSYKPCCGLRKDCPILDCVGSPP